MNYLNVFLKILLILASLTYIITDVFFIGTGTIPSLFILIENVIYSVIYFSLFISLLRNVNREKIALLTAIIASFNAGRVSGSIIDSLGRISPLAEMHVPLLVGLVILIIVAFLNSAVLHN